MIDERLAQLSNAAFIVAFAGYVLAMVGYFFRLAFQRVTGDGAVAATGGGQRVGRAATILACASALVHLGSLVTRGLATGRPPWLNMYEYSSVIAFVAVAAGLAVVQRRYGYANLMGFVLAASVLTMGAALLLFTDAAPVQPALDSWWRLVHVTTIGFSSSIFMVGFAVAALYLVKDTAERRASARSGASFTGSTVGAAGVAPVEAGLPEGYAPDDGPDARIASPLGQREVLSPRLLVGVPLVLAATSAFALSRSPVQALVWGGAFGALGAATWFAVPFLPEAERLDSLAYRINAFAFPIYTFAVITGAIWAEVAWGRYWGWDPKETSAFFTWVFYAGYLHARSTRGWRGRKAAWINVIAYAALLVTYYVVNLVVVGLHSYAEG